MLKGHVQIDLHNHNSGFTERFEQDNMVTDALKYVIQNYIGSNNVPNADNGIMPIATRALGGLMLFDGNLTEDASNIHFPSEAHLVAYAGQDVNTSNVIGGSKNVSESKEIDHGYQSVWDFSTAQANGSIKALALTSHFNNPFMGMNPNVVMHRINWINGDRALTQFPLIYDQDNQIMYFIGYGGYTYSSTRDPNRYIYTYHFTFTIYKEYIPTDKYKVSDAADRADFPEVVTQISFDIEDFSSDPRYGFVNAYDGYAYCVWCKSNKDGDGKFIYRRMKLSDFSFELSDPVEVTVKSCALRGGFSNCVVNDGKCYLIGYNTRFIYVVDLQNPVNVRSVDLGEGCWAQPDYYLWNYRKGIVKFHAVTNSAPGRYYYNDALLYPDGWVIHDAPYYESTSISTFKGHERFTYQTPGLLTFGAPYNYMSYGFPVNNYLGTICNLSSAITKTAASSMKVTYTLTDV